MQLSFAVAFHPSNHQCASTRLTTSFTVSEVKLKDCRLLGLLCHEISNNSRPNINKILGHGSEILVIIYLKVSNILWTNRIHIMFGAHPKSNTTCNTSAPSVPQSLDWKSILPSSIQNLPHPSTTFSGCIKIYNNDLGQVCGLPFEYLTAVKQNSKPLHVVQCPPSLDVDGAMFQSS